MQRVSDCGFTGCLQIIHDGCYSGWWAYSAKEIWYGKEKVTPDPSKISKNSNRSLEAKYEKDPRWGFSRLFIVTSAGPDKMADWGGYRKYLISKDVDGMTMVGRQQLERKYALTFGTCIFDSTQNYDNSMTDYGK